jgi:hypothetical protein
MDTRHHTTPAFLDGPRLHQWVLDEEGGHMRNQEGRLGNRLKEFRRWRDGEPANAADADVVLLKLGLHLGMVPDEIYIAEREGLLSAA